MSLHTFRADSAWAWDCGGGRIDPEQAMIRIDKRANLFRFHTTWEALRGMACSAVYMYDFLA